MNHKNDSDTPSSPKLSSNDKYNSSLFVERYKEYLPSGEKGCILSLFPNKYVSKCLPVPSASNRLFAFFLRYHPMLSGLEFRLDL